MKVAWVTLAIVVAAALGLLLISLFGDITVTNQQDYTLMKNSAEASMYEAKDDIAYNNGICVCTNKEKKNGKFNFNRASDYYVETIRESGKDCEDLDLVGTGSNQFNYCEKMVGEYKINKEMFAESFVRRFAESVKGDTEYKIDIIDVVEYPPKVSVRITSYDNYQISNAKEATFKASDYGIVNELDAIIEYSGEKKDEEQEEKKEPQKVCSADDVNVMIVIDASSTMGSSRINVINTTKKFINNLNANNIKFGYSIFNEAVRKTGPVGTKAENFTYSTDGGSNVGLGVQCGLYLLGYDTKKPYNCDSTPHTLDKKFKNYLILMGDGVYSPHKFNIYGNSQIKSADSLRSYMTGFSNLETFGIAYGKGSSNDTAENIRMRTLVGGKNRLYRSKELKETELETIYNAIFNEVKQECHEIY